VAAFHKGTRENSSQKWKPRNGKQSITKITWP
jgi:hypothetical protein